LQDPISPTRIFHEVSVSQPEKRLLLALLAGAIDDFRNYATASTGRGRRLFADVNAWFGSTSHERLLDFETICDGLGLDPSFLRGGLRRWRAVRCGATGARLQRHD
jgi:hypothetical protein